MFSQKSKFQASHFEIATGCTFNYFSDKMQANYFGNDMVLRDGYFSAEAQKSWLLYDTQLDDGILQEIRFYVHDIAENV